MCKTPQVAQTDWSRARMLSVMESRQLIQLPVVDNLGRVVDSRRSTICWRNANATIQYF